MHINADPRRRKDPYCTDDSPFQSNSFTYSGLALWSSGRCTVTRTPGRFLSEYFARIARSPALLNDSEISWGTCEIFEVNSTDPHFQCGYFEVPMDYHDSSAGNARLAVMKYAATVEKQGTIFFNPGDHPFYPPSFRGVSLMPHCFRWTWGFRNRGP